MAWQTVVGIPSSRPWRAPIRSARSGWRGRPGIGSHAESETPLDALSPRDIQARIRAGASPAEVAADCGMPLDRVERFSGPPLAERDWVAQLAQQTAVRGGTPDASLATILADAVSSEEVQWDSWRRDDGRWAVQASWGKQAATWSFDPRTKSLHALDDAAVALTGNSHQTSVISLPASRGSVDLFASTVDAEASVDEGTVIEVVELIETAEVVTLSPSDRDGEPAPEPSAKGKRGRRASVPSWDEILFGAGQPE